MTTGQAATSNLFRRRDYVLRRTFIFLDSLRKSGIQADVLFLTDSHYKEPIKRMLKRYNARYMVMRDSDSVFADTHIEPGNVRRHAWYVTALRHVGHQYRHVLVTDVRDVYFQRDPFSRFNRFDAVLTRESNRVAANGLYFQTHSRLSGYTGSEVAACTDPPISGGILFGTPSSIVNISSSLLAEAVLRRYYAHDQHYFNHLLRQGKLRDVTVLPNRVLTWHMGVKPLTFTLNEFGELLNDSLQVVPIIHQYDREPTVRLAHFLEHRHIFLPNLNRTHTLDDHDSTFLPSFGNSPKLRESV